MNSVILARALGVERLGAYAYAMGLAGLFALVPNLGINHVVTRAIARDPHGEGVEVFRAGRRAQALLAGGICVIIPSFAAALPAQPVPLAFVGLAAAQFAVGTLSWPYLAVLGGYTRYDRVAVVELVSAVTGTGTLLLALALHGGVGSVLLAHCGAAVLSVAFTVQLTRAFLPAADGRVLGTGALLRQVAPFGAAATVQSLYTRLDVLLLGQLASTRALGLYNVAYKPANMLVYFGSSLAGPVFPVMARAPRREAPPQFRRALWALGVAGPGIAIALTGLAGPLITLLFGSIFASAAPVLGVLAWSAAANWLYAPLAMALQAQGQERAWLAGLGGALALNAAGNLWAIPRWGALGAAAATLASEVFLVILGAALLWRGLGLRPAPRPVLAGLGAAAAGGAALWALWSWGPFAGTAVALLVYSGLLVGLRVVTARDVALVIGWFREAGPALWDRRAAV
jgi:O-antigen/teichoic acid export membrane protein